MSGPYQRQDLSNYGTGRLGVAINCGVLSVNCCSCEKSASALRRLSTLQSEE